MKQYDYAERLWIHWSIPAFLTFIAGSLAIAYGRVYGPEFGIGTCFVSLLVVAAITLRVSPRLLITVTELTVGKATLPLKAIGVATALDKSDTQRLLTSPVHGQGFMVIRPGIHNSVLVEVIDEHDPHPYWHVSSRNAFHVASLLSSRANS